MLQVLEEEDPSLDLLEQAVNSEVFHEKSDSLQTIIDLGQPINIFS